jgi:hypothetical protein
MKTKSNQHTNTSSNKQNKESKNNNKSNQIKSNEQTNKQTKQTHLDSAGYASSPNINLNTVPANTPLYLAVNITYQFDTGHRDGK